MTRPHPARRRLARLRQHGFAEEGSTTLEFVVLVPGALLILSVIAFSGRVAIANQAVAQAADEAARTASVARTQSAATREATSTASGVLTQQGLQCSSTKVSVNSTGFARAAGQDASVSATVTCVVRLNDLKLPFPGSRTVTATATSPLDTYRER